MMPIARRRTTLLFIAAIAVLSFHAHGQIIPEAAPNWTTDLKEQWGLRPFVSDPSLAWSKEQNVVFLNSDQVAVYQVNELRTPATLEERDVTGGAGNFFLEVRIFDIHDGRALKVFRLRTNAGLSRILPTHDGNWIARTGEVMYVFSPEFETLASRRLPLERVGPIEFWQLNVTPSGKQAVVVHQQVFSMEDSAIQKKGSAKTDVDLVDADTLRTIKSFSIQRTLHSWSAIDDFLVTPDPGKQAQASRFGLLDFEGHWSAFQRELENCRAEIDALRPQSIAMHGCGRLGLFSLSGEELFALKTDIHDHIGSVERSEDFLAIEYDREVLRSFPGLNFAMRVPKPVRIDAYDITGGKLLVSLPVMGDDVYYALSPQGTLAVVDGSSLKVFALDHIAVREAQKR